MTKREICERLVTIYAEENYEMAEDIKKLLLDLAAPETEEEKEEAFRERCRAVLGDIAATGKKEPEDHFADLGKKGATLPDGTPINLCGGHE